MRLTKNEKFRALAHFADEVIKMTHKCDPIDHRPIFLLATQLKLIEIGRDKDMQSIYFITPNWIKEAAE